MEVLPEKKPEEHFDSNCITPVCCANLLIYNTRSKCFNQKGGCAEGSTYLIKYSLNFPPYNSDPLLSHKTHRFLDVCGRNST